MAGSLNKVLLIGRLGADPEIKQMVNGKSVARLSLATSQSWKDKSTGSHREKTVLVATFLHRTPGTFKDVTASQPSEEFQPKPVDQDPFPAEGTDSVPF